MPPGAEGRSARFAPREARDPIAAPPLTDPSAQLPHRSGDLRFLQRNGCPPLKEERGGQESESGAAEDIRKVVRAVIDARERDQHRNREKKDFPAWEEMRQDQGQGK